MSATKKKAPPYFLPYQQNWLLDNSRFKIVEKSRRVGYTYVQSYEDVYDCVTLSNFPPNGPPNVYFSSADETAALEYITYCTQWAEMFDMAATDLGEVVLDSKNDIRAFVIEFANGAKIHALRSNPKAFRSKGGKIVLDEFAFHDDPDALWKAAMPCITWGYSVRVLSTHNGMGQRYYQIIEEIKKAVAAGEKSKWSLHRTTIEDAIEQGLVEKIKGLDRPATEQEKADFLAECKEIAGDDDTFNQEFMCVAADEATAFLTYDLIRSVESPELILPDDLSGIAGDLYLGVDIGRRKDLTTMWLDEKVGDVLYTRKLIELYKTKFRDQRDILYGLLEHPRLRRACIDSTGLGMQLAEEAQDVFGTYKVEGVTFTAPVKEELAITMRRNFEDRGSRIPARREIREDFHSIKKVTTVAGNIRYDAARSDAGHADRFWAKALAIHAASNPPGPIEYKTVGKRRMAKIVGAY